MTQLSLDDAETYKGYTLVVTTGMFLVSCNAYKAGNRMIGWETAGTDGDDAKEQMRRRIDYKLSKMTN